ncbi:hypothetical protein BAUCODRAFT_125512 [Baudoinia panamericana UAMH 10762]|uniref:Beta-lactamase-related domain-containing protein n=1 Tax=Baudoinia panamericana (strain UAMH 10762) TaxID=717646 RepID=M2MB22_BAUPA|nr:uncharacterized protein BAUCODRAFT_125512 [Baudoinia panamericana UAMH 10762]EMC93676.1 hypothetical protein BAUCODRAFT_125512 [Baudoinia panamericana UAMH 10762]
MAEAQATLGNWRDAPHSQWGFANVDKIILTEAIKASKQPKAFEDEKKSFNDFKIRLLQIPILSLSSYLQHTSTDGIVVLHKGTVGYEHYDHGNTGTTKHILMSITKSVTGLITGILSEKGVIDLNAPIKQYVPEASSIFDDVTVQQCLDMSSGIKYNDNIPEYRGAAGWAPLPPDAKALTLHHFLSTVEAPTTGPGSAFNYCSLNTDLLGWALERASGRKLAELITELLWQPLGAESDALLTVDSEGSPRNAGGLCATVRDLARLGQLVAEGGRGIVPPGWIDDMLNGGDKALWSKGAFAPMFYGNYSSVAYRSCWYADSETATLIAIGIHGQQLMVDVKNNIVMAKTASQADPVSGMNIVANVLAFKEFRRILLG